LFPFESDLSILKIAANLKRIADLSTNIFGDVIHFVEGKLIKYHGKDKSQQGDGVLKFATHIAFILELAYVAISVARDMD
jgi:hypothetical protein